MNVGRLVIGLLGCLAVAALILSLAALIILANRTESFTGLQQALERILGG